MWWLILSASAHPALSLAGTTRSQGDSPLQLCLAPSAESVDAALWWAAFDRISFETVLPLQDGCASKEFAPISDRITGSCRSISARVADKHPVYDYIDHPTLRCALGDDTAWCKLPYTGWFELRVVPEGCVAARSERAAAPRE